MHTTRRHFLARAGGTLLGVVAAPQLVRLRTPTARAQAIPGAPSFQREHSMLRRVGLLVVVALALLAVARHGGIAAAQGLQTTVHTTVNRVTIEYDHGVEGDEVISARLQVAFAAAAASETDPLLQGIFTDIANKPEERQAIVDRVAGVFDPQTGEWLVEQHHDEDNVAVAQNVGDALQPAHQAATQAFDAATMHGLQGDQRAAAQQVVDGVLNPTPLPPVTPPPAQPAPVAKVCDGVYLAVSAGGLIPYGGSQQADPVTRYVVHCPDHEDLRTQYTYSWRITAFGSCPTPPLSLSERILTIGDTTPASPNGQAAATGPAWTASFSFGDASLASGRRCDEIGVPMIFLVIHAGDSYDNDVIIQGPAGCTLPGGATGDECRRIRPTGPLY